MAGILICMVFIISAAATAATVEMVTVGDPGNAPDPSTGGRFGAVAYQYRIGKYEVTLGEYTAFLNAVAKSDPYGLFTPDLQSADLVGGIARSGSPGSYSYAVMGPTGTIPPGAATPENRPISCVNWFSAARFANWMANGQGSGSTESGAYTMSTGVVTTATRVGGVNTYTLAAPAPLSLGDQVSVTGLVGTGFNVTGTVTSVTGLQFTMSNTNADATATGIGSINGSSRTRAPTATYFIPTEDEWYKAAFYSPLLNSGSGGYYTYATQSNNPPGNMIGDLPNQANYALGGVYAMTQSVNIVAGQSYASGGGALSNSASYYGTFDQNGNVSEWNELIFGTAATRNTGTPGGFRGGRGGSWLDTDSSQLASSHRVGFYASVYGGNVGFRLAGSATAPIPEIDPNSAGGVVALVAGFLAWFERRGGRSRRPRPSPALPHNRSAELLTAVAQAVAALAAAIIIGRPVTAATTDTVQYLSSPASYGAVGNGLNLEFGTKAFPPLTETALEAYQVQGSGPVTLTFRMHADTGSFRFNFGYYKYLPSLNAIDTSTTAGKQAYATTALAPGNAVLVFNDVIHDPGATTTKTVNGGDLLGFFLIPDDTLSNFQTNPASFAVTGVGSATFGIGGARRWPFFGYAAANPGGKDQLMSFSGTSTATGKRSNMFAWEDISRASLPGDFSCDNAFNDLIFAVEGVEAAATTPSAIPEIDPGSVAGVAALVIATLAWIERRRR